MGELGSSALTSGDVSTFFAGIDLMPFGALLLDTRSFFADLLC